jgi:uncharacterized membrane protein YbhN (UPF0104 family)
VQELLSKVKFTVIVVLVVSVFVGLVAYGDFGDVSQKLMEYPVSYLLAALSLALINYLLRFFRWAYFLKILEIDIPFRSSVVIFMTGLALSITPAKVGEFFKCYLLRRKFDVPISRSASVVVMERIGDVGSVLVVGATGMAFLPEISVWIIGFAIVSLIILLLVFKSGNGEWLYGFPFLSRWKLSIKMSETSFKRLVKLDAISVSLCLGVLAWFSEGIALYIILKGLGAEIKLFWSVPVYAWSTIVGAASTLPGGIVGTEASMVVLLLQAGVGRTDAAAAVLLVRLATLWFAVLIGVVALVFIRKIGDTSE